VAGGAAAQLLLPGGWLFPGRNPVEPLTARQFCRAVHAAAQAAAIKKRVSPHTLRHSFATHLLEQDVDIRVIQVLLGHAKLDTTALYTRVANTTICSVTSPLDRLAPSIEGRPRPEAGGRRRLSSPWGRLPPGQCRASSAGRMRTCSTGCRTASTACPRPWACGDRPSNTRSGPLKAWMGATHFLTRTLDKVRTEMSLHVLAYNLKRMITILGVGPLMAAIRT
jgi:hypothetical protein